MIIRATNKIFNISRIGPKISTSENTQDFPGEWNANLISQLIPGKLAIHFFHNPTYISIIIPGKSISSAVQELPNKTIDLLTRNGYEKLIDRYDLDSEVNFLKSNNRSIQGYLNNMKYDIEFQFSKYYSDEIIDYKRIEDYLLGYLLGGKNIRGYISPSEILEKKIKNL